MSINCDLSTEEQQSNKFNHISFSFDNKRQEQKEARKTIDQYLRLKTNQSIQDKPNISSKRNNCYRKSQESETESHYQIQLKNDEQTLRIESLTKQYQLKLAKQEQFFALRQWKMKQQIQNLNLQIGSLNEEIRRLRAAAKQQSTHCSLCSNGEIINHLTSVLKQAEKNHEHCLQEKKQMTRKLDTANGKLESLEQDQEKVYQQCKSLSKQLRNCSSQINQIEQEKLQIKQAFSKKEEAWQSKLASYQKSIDELAKKISNFQRKQEERNITNSKVTLQSTQAPLMNIQNNNNMRSSFNNTRNSSLQKQRSSISKIIPQKSQFGNLENYSNYRKMSENGKQTKYNELKTSHQIENIKWKFF